MAPEVIHRGTFSGYNSLCYCWSLGVVLYQLLSRRITWKDDLPLEVQIEKGKYNINSEE